MAYLGIIFALVALVSWGLGDFFIQRTSRKTGVMDSLFYIVIVAVVVLLPFVWTDLQSLDSRSISILFVAGLFILTASFCLFQSLKVGKLSIVEPVASLELPFTVLVAGLAGHEHLSIPTYLIIAVVFLGIFLSVTQGHHVLKIHQWERGTWYAFFGAIFMALSNFTIGYASQETSPVMSIWATSLIILIPCLLYYIVTNRFGLMIKHLRTYPGTVLAETIFDNGAWLAYAFAVVYIPISVAITISESYIILAVLLGLIVNRERLKHHQALGVILAIGGVLLLSWLAS